MIQPHQQRVIDEKAELDGRIAKLAAFVESPCSFPCVTTNKSVLKTSST